MHAQLKAANDEIARLQEEVADYREQLTLLTSQLTSQLHDEQQRRAQQAYNYKVVSSFAV